MRCFVPQCNSDDDFIYELTVLAANTLPNQVVVQAGDVTVADLIPDDQGVRGALFRQYSTIGLGKAPDHGKKASNLWSLYPTASQSVRITRNTSSRCRNPSRCQRQHHGSPTIGVHQKEASSPIGKRLKLERVEAVGDLQTLKCHRVVAQEEFVWHQGHVSPLGPVSVWTL